MSKPLHCPSRSAPALKNGCNQSRQLPTVDHLDRAPSVVPFVPSPEQLLEVIRIQTQIARHGHDLSAVMDLVTRETVQLLQVDGAAIELAAWWSGEITGTGPYR